MITRRKSVAAVVGGVKVGGGAPIVVQSMTNTDTADIESTVAQVRSLARAGSELVRVTVNTEERAKLGQEIMRLHEENVWVIGVVQLPFQPVVVSKDLINVRKAGIASFRLQHIGQTWPEQVSFKAGSPRLRN